MPYVYFLIGPPACGKSTYIEEHFPDMMVISSDAIVERIAKERGLTYHEMMLEYPAEQILQEHRNQITKAVLGDKDVVIDRTNTTPEDRKLYSDMFPLSYEKRAIIFRFDAEDLKERAKKRFEETGKFIPEDVMDRKIVECKKVNGIDLTSEGFAYRYADSIKDMYLTSIEVKSESRTIRL